MSLKMPSPRRDAKSGVWLLSQRVPRDLLYLKGTSVRLPVGDEMVPVKLGEQVRLSLRTTSQSVAKTRYRIADAALNRVWETARSDLAPSKVKSLPNGHRPATPESQRRTIAQLVSEAVEETSTIDSPEVRDGYAAILRADLTDFMSKIGDGRSGIVDPADISFADLSSRWFEEFTDKRAANTIRRYRSVVKDFTAVIGDKPIRSITPEEIYDWAAARMDRVSVRTINSVDLTAIKSMFGYANSMATKRLLKANPAAGILMEGPRAARHEKVGFSEDEIASILSASQAVAIDEANPTLSYAQRWCPWLCAYTGARITDITSLRAENILFQKPCWAMKIFRRKTQTWATLPLHEHLVELGFVEFAREIGTGPLFYDPRRHDPDSEAPPAELRSQDLARWIRTRVSIKSDAQPNHGWRHTFSNIAEDFMTRSASYGMTGHSEGNAGGIYRKATYRQLANAIQKFPRYRINKRELGADSRS